MPPRAADRDKTPLLVANTINPWAWDPEEDPTGGPPVTVTSVLYDVRTEDHDGYCSDQDFGHGTSAKKTWERRVELWITDAATHPPPAHLAMNPDTHIVCGCAGRTAELVSAGPVPWERVMKEAG